MRIVFKSILLIVTLLVLVIFWNYPKLNILAGYSAKSTASSVFLAGRTLKFTDTTDNAFSPIKLVKDVINREQRTATASALNLLTRKAIYRDGLGSVLLTKKNFQQLGTTTPKRRVANDTTPFPYGNADPKDTVFESVDYKRLTIAINRLFDDVNKTRAVLVVYKNNIIAESYGAGFDKNSKLLGWSMTKSITGTLFGILQFQGKLNIQSKAPIQAWQSDSRKHITIHNLLQMNSGLEWEEDYNSISDATRMLFLEEDMTKTQLRKPLLGEPNNSWNYSSGTTNLLSGILRQQFPTHQDYLNFWYSDLIDKIGMNSMIIETDLSGNYIGSSYGWATARDWSKLGLLYLNNGLWNKERLFTKDWVDYATTATPTSKGWYGAQLWLNQGKRYPDLPTNMYSFNGYQGQNVFILPDDDLVIVRMGLTKNADMNSFIADILKSIHNTKP